MSPEPRVLSPAAVIWRCRGEISAYARGANVVIAMAFKNARQSLRQALRSALAQRLSEGHCAVLLLDDQSDDAWLGAVNDWLDDPAVIRVLGNCGSAAHARNAALDFVERELPAARWVARLDADDVFDSTVSVEALRAAGEANTSEFVVGSNALVDRFASELPDNIAHADRLLNPAKLMSFIEAFCSGRSEQELPSCNLLIRTGLGIRYPSMKSAEDHWLVAGLLLHRRDRASVVSRPLYCRYRLDGPVTTENRGEGEFHRSRKRLAEACGVWAEIIRQGKEVLGYGLEGCVWHEAGWVYKRFYPWAGDVRHMDWLPVSANRNSRSEVVTMFSISELAWASSSGIALISIVGLGRASLSCLSSASLARTSMHSFRTERVSSSAFGGRGGRSLKGVPGENGMSRFLCNLSTYMDDVSID